MDNFDKSLFNSIICNISDPNIKPILEGLYKFDPILFYDSTLGKWNELYTQIINKMTKVSINSLFNYMNIFTSSIFKRYYEETNKGPIKDIICTYLQVVATYLKIPKVHFISIVFQLLNTYLTFSFTNYGEIWTDVQAKVISDGDGLKYKKIEVKSDIDNLIYSNLAEYRDQIAMAEVLTYQPSNGQTEIIMDIPIVTTVVTELITLQNTMSEIASQNFCKFVPFLSTVDDTARPEQFSI